MDIESNDICYCYHSLCLVVWLVTTRCHSYGLLSLVVWLVVCCCHSLYVARLSFYQQSCWTAPSGCTLSHLTFAVVITPFFPLYQILNNSKSPYITVKFFFDIACTSPDNGERISFFISIFCLSCIFFKYSFLRNLFASF